MMFTRIFTQSSIACGLFFLLASMQAMALSPLPPRPKITVFAAASMKESLDAVAAEWKKKTTQEVVVSYAASSALAKQIEQGAPADIYISADADWMDYLQKAGKIDVKTRFDLAGNRLVLIAPASSKQAVVSLKNPDAFRQALGDGRLAIAETGSVPAGRYAKQALTKLNLWDSVSGKLAQGENVRAAMAFVARGESPLGIVYSTDADAEPKVRVLAVFADDSHDAIVYPVAKVASADMASASGFLAFLKSKEAKAIFKRSGFRLF